MLRDKTLNEPKQTIRNIKKQKRIPETIAQSVPPQYQKPNGRYPKRQTPVATKILTFGVYENGVQTIREEK